jgi:hypothetical protein
MQFPALLRRNQGAFELTVADLPGVRVTGRSVGEAISRAERAVFARCMEMQRQGRTPKPTPFDAWWPFQDLEGALATTVEIDLNENTSGQRHERARRSAPFPVPDLI